MAGYTGLSQRVPGAPIIHPIQVMPPEYHLQSFWDDRFEKERHFEWLGDGRETLIPILSDHLRSLLRQQRDPPHAAPQCLHIGAGTSKLSDHIRGAYIEVYGEATNEGAIVNLDFSEAAVQKGIEAEIARIHRQSHDRRNIGMQWVQADVLKWGDLAPLLGSDPRRHEDAGQRARFEIVLDKSTSDAISCGDDIVVEDGLAPSVANSPVVERLAAQQGYPLRLQPVILLALHLANLIHPGGLWISLSFSSTRFSFMHAPEGDDRRNDGIQAALSRYWILEQHRTVDAPSGQTKPGVYAPSIQYFVYVLRRTGVVVE
ncbi:uncharacterized protein LAESUDRAFT_730226 [Laetiporus sulphureus 93-53]|uniref:Uncharacterized protein n=1 Tax=Laetiporus sulphureus 93-53 TaxID=1314785 RepID=A0A165CAU9_9APHY|nr:uncharacterized protein LAESUDRAFT_730226 [Laetiporus sulphureus 93-53]KZT02478.1 hypothetical protein LAESUDRAFT_730226 [Laetiporus sulphureus 93-53]